MKGAMFFYIDVGQLPKAQVRKFLDGLKEDNSEFFNNIPEDIGVMFIPVRNQASRVEFMMLEPSK